MTLTLRVCTVLFLALVAGPAPAQAPVRPARPLIYTYEHRELPAAVFRNDQDVVLWLERGVPEAALRLWIKALMTSGRATQAPTDDATRQLDEAADFARQVAVKRVAQNGFTVYALTMPPPEFSPEAHFIAIAYKDGEPREIDQPSPSTRYITLEKAAGEQRYAVCEWNASHEHSLRGFVDGVPNLDTFIAMAFSMLE